MVLLWRRSHLASSQIALSTTALISVHPRAEHEFRKTVYYYWWGGSFLITLGRQSPRTVLRKRRCLLTGELGVGQSPSGSAWSLVREEMGISLSLVEVTEQTNRVALVVASKPLCREEVDAAVREEMPHEGTGRAR